MRTICDVCESAAAILFCAADEAALCQACDDKVHKCNKLANRHVRVGLAEPSAISRCDICENAPAFFYCEIDGSSLCLQCDMIVHVGGKRTHGRYLMLRQRIEWPGDIPGTLDDPRSQRGVRGETNREPDRMTSLRTNENQQNHRVSPIPLLGNNNDNDGRIESRFIDLNARPQRMHGHSPNNEGRVNTLAHDNHESESVVPNGYYKREPGK